MIGPTPDSVMGWPEFSLQALLYDYESNCFSKAYICQEIRNFLSENGYDMDLCVIDENKSIYPEKIPFVSIHDGMTVHLSRNFNMEIAIFNLLLGLTHVNSCLKVIGPDRNSVKKWPKFPLNTLEYDYEGKYFPKAYIFEEIENFLSQNGYDMDLCVIDENKSIFPENIPFVSIHDGLTVYLTGKCSIYSSKLLYFV